MGEIVARWALPACVLAWPPMQRIEASSRPGSRSIGLRHVLAALAAEACGDGATWPLLAERMLDAGLLLSSDPPRPRVLTGPGARVLPFVLAAERAG